MTLGTFVKDLCKISDYLESDENTSFRIKTKFQESKKIKLNRFYKTCCEKISGIEFDSKQKKITHDIRKHEKTLFKNQKFKEPKPHENSIKETHIHGKNNHIYSKNCPNENINENHQIHAASQLNALSSRSHPQECMFQYNADHFPNGCAPISRSYSNNFQSDLSLNDLESTILSKMPNYNLDKIKPRPLPKCIKYEEVEVLPLSRFMFNKKNKCHVKVIPLDHCHASTGNLVKTLYNKSQLSYNKYHSCMSPKSSGSCSSENKLSELSKFNFNLSNENTSQVVSILNAESPISKNEGATLRDDAFIDDFRENNGSISNFNHVSACTQHQLRVKNFQDNKFGYHSSLLNGFLEKRSYDYADILGYQIESTENHELPNLGSAYDKYSNDCENAGLFVPYRDYSILFSKNNLNDSSWEKNPSSVKENKQDSQQEEQLLDNTLIKQYSSEEKVELLIGMVDDIILQFLSAGSH